MFLQRSRYLRGKEALKAWRTRHSLRVLQCMRHDVFRQKKIESGLESVRKANQLPAWSASFFCCVTGLFVYGLCASNMVLQRADLLES